MGREQVVLAHHPEHPLAGNTDATTDPKPSPDLAVSLALPGGCLQVGLDGHQQSLVRDRGLRSPALCWWALSGGLLPGFHGVERGTGKTPGRTDPLEAVGQPVPGRGGGTHRRDLRRPKGPDVSVLASSSSTCMINSPDPLMAMSSSRLHRIALRSLSEASIPAIAFSRHCSSRKISTPNCRDKSFHGSPRKSRRATSRCASPSTAGQVPSGPAGETWPGKTWTSQARPRLPQAHQQQLCSQKLSVMFRSSLTLRLSQFCVQGNRVRLKFVSCGRPE